MVLNVKSLESAENKPYCRAHRPAPKATAVKAQDSFAVNNALNAPKKKAEGLSTAHKGARELAPTSKGDFGVNNSNIDQSTENKPTSSTLGTTQNDRPERPTQAAPIQKPASNQPAARPPVKPTSAPAPPKANPPPPRAAPPPARPAPPPVQEQQVEVVQEEQVEVVQEQVEVVQEQVEVVQEEQPYQEEQPVQEEQQQEQNKRNVRALYEYQGENDTDLVFKEGDVIIVLDDTDPSGWYHGELNGVQGYFPSNFVEPL